MRIQLNEDTYIVMFQHFTPHRKKKETQLVKDWIVDGHTYPRPTSTLCGVYRIAENSGDDFRLAPVGFGLSRVNPGEKLSVLGRSFVSGGDAFNRVIGKKVALKKAFNSAPNYFTRDERKLIFHRVFGG